MAERALTLLETARDRDVDVTADHHFYTESSTMLQVLLPPWMLEYDPDERIKKLRDDEIRDRIRQDILDWEIKWWENHAMRAGWGNITITSVGTGANEHIERMTIEQIANSRDEDPVDVVCDLLVEEELEVSQVVRSLACEDVEKILQDERVAVASDALLSTRPHPRTYGTYPRVLGAYVREDSLLTVAEAVCKMTSLPARIIGLDRKDSSEPGWMPIWSSSTRILSQVPLRTNIRSSIRSVSNTFSSTGSLSFATANSRIVV
jgi:N-acyl-D-amino-acid deacylase